MSNLNELARVSEVALSGSVAMIFLVKIILFFIYEKEWNSLTFFHFSKMQLKMTVNKELRKWRREQNNLTRVMLFLILLLLFSSSFYLLIKG